MTRARCTHCQGVFTVGGTRDCCLTGAVAEQNRLRDRVRTLESERTRKAAQELNDIFSGLHRGMR